MFSGEGWMDIVEVEKRGITPFDLASAARMFAAHMFPGEGAA